MSTLSLSEQINNDFIFLKDKWEDNGIAYAISPDQIKTLNVADTYDRWGQIVGHENAGDHHPENQYSDFEESDEEVLTKCQGFNYWDGYNWKSVVISHDHTDDGVSHELIQDSELIKVYLEAINEMELDSEGFGKKIYTTEKYKIVESFYASAWETYRIEESDDF